MVAQVHLFSLSRNVGEVLGVFGDFTIPEKPTLFNFGYHSSVKFAELRALEEQLKTLWSPTWPDTFPKIDQDDAAKGAALYRMKLENGQSCLDCHALIDHKDPNRTVEAVIADTGTDRRAFENFFIKPRPSGRLEGVRMKIALPSAEIPAQAQADMILARVVASVILGGLQDAPLDALDQLTSHGKRAVVAGSAPYKARPLNGIWATAPYLHNGSVPNLDALLRPAKDRPTSFSIGTRTFDPEKVGLRHRRPGIPQVRSHRPGEQSGYRPL